MTLRRVEQSPVYQGQDETVAYIFDWTNIGTPTGGTCVLYDMGSWTSLGTANLTGAASSGGGSITSPGVFGLAAGKHYQLNCIGTISGNTLSSFVEIIGEM